MTSALFLSIPLTAFSGSFIGSAQAQPAINDQRLSRDEITAGYQAENGHGDFVGSSDALQRKAGGSFGDRLGIFLDEMLAHPRRIRKGRRDTIHANPRRQRSG